MTKSETAYVAGVLEGEACFDYNRTPKYPRVRVEMSDPDVIGRLQVLLGGRVTEPPKRQGHWRQTYLLTVNGAEAIRAMRAVRPWMSLRRGDKIDALLASC